MNVPELFSHSIYEEQTILAERELTAFLSSVTALFGAEQTPSAKHIWLEEADLPDTPPLSIDRDWRTVTIAASARALGHINDKRHHPTPFCAASINTNRSPVPTSNCLAHPLLA